MVCPNCGFNCDDGSKICSRCGNKFKKKVKVKTVIAIISFVLALIAIIVAVVFMNDCKTIQGYIDNCDDRINRMTSDKDKLSLMCEDINDNIEESVVLVNELDYLFEDIEDYDNVLSAYDKIEELRELNESLDEMLAKAKPYADIPNYSTEFLEYFDEQYDIAMSYHTETDPLMKSSYAGQVSTNRSMRDAEYSYSHTNPLMGMDAYSSVHSIELRIDNQYLERNVQKRLYDEYMIYAILGFVASGILIVIGFVFLVYKKKSEIVYVKAE